MFNDFTNIRGSIWKQRVNSGLGMIFLSSCALWAGLVMTEAVWNTNPVARAFSAMVARETTLPN